MKTLGLCESEPELFVFIGNHGYNAGDEYL